MMHRPKQKAIDNFKPFWTTPPPKICKPVQKSDGSTGLGFFCGCFWGMVISAPVYAFLYYIFIW